MAAGQIAKAKIPNANAREMFDSIIERFKHATNLPVDSLPQDDAQAHRADGMKPFDSRPFTVEKNSFRYFRSQRRVPSAVQRHFIFLVDLVTRMGESLGEIAIVGDQKQSLGLSVESTDVEEPGKFWRKQVENGVASVKIFSG